MQDGRGTSRTFGSSDHLLVVTKLVSIGRLRRCAHVRGDASHRGPAQGGAKLALEVDRFLTPVVLLKKSHLFFSRLLLRLVLIF